MGVVFAQMTQHLISLFHIFADHCEASEAVLAYFYNYYLHLAKVLISWRRGPLGLTEGR